MRTSSSSPAPTANFRTLEFREKADFENPGDSNGDNIYEVTVVASDGTNQAERSVTVKITDSDEAGTITLSDAESGDRQCSNCHPYRLGRPGHQCRLADGTP